MSETKKETKKTTAKKTIKKVETKETPKKKTSGKTAVAKQADKTKETPKRRKKQQIDRDEMVLCRNLTSGGLIYKSNRSGIEVVWDNYGDEEWIDVGELLTMKASQPKFLREGWILIDDEEIAQYLGVKKVYDELASLVDLEGFFELPTKEAKQILLKLPKGVKETIGEIAKKKVVDNTIKNFQLLRVLEQELKIDLIQLMD